MAPVKQDSASHNMLCLLREWDRAPKEKRRQFLQDFIDQHWNRSGPEIESELAQMASLFLARICVWIKLTYMCGTCLTEQLQALYIFLSASCSYNYLLEFLEHGGVLCLQELCVSPSSKEVDKFWAIKVLSCVANAGTRYKEAICECYGIRAVAECMAKSRSEDTQKTACALLETLAEGNPHFADQVYKGLIGVLPCNSPKAQVLAMQCIRILQLNRESANRSLIDRVICLLESMHLEVQSAVIELVRTLVQYDIVDDILMAVTSLLRPQREIQLGKLFTEDAGSQSDVDSSDSTDQSSVLSDDESSILSTVDTKCLALRTKPTESSEGGGGCGGCNKLQSKSKTVFTSKCRFKKSKMGSKHAHDSVNTSTVATVTNNKTKKKKHKSNSGSNRQPLPVFVQQAAAAKCILILSRDSSTNAVKLLNIGALSGLLYAMGNLEYTDSQRQASLTLEYFCQTFPLVRQIVREAMGSCLFDEFIANPEAHYLQMTPLQADVLVSNKVTFNADIVDV